MTTQSGFGIIASIFLILLISMLTVFSASLFSTDIQISLDSLRSAQALYLCEGAIQYCIKNELKADTDWSDNSDKVNIPVGNGSISIYYDPNTTATETTIRVVGTVDDVSRQITRSFEISWPDEQADFPYSLFAQKPISGEGSGVSIETPYEEDNKDCPNIKCDFNYYYGIADTVIGGNWNKSSQIDITYTDIFYINGDVTFFQCPNNTINGTIIATGKITMDQCNGLTINPSGNHPALISESGDIKIVDSDNVTIGGMVYSESAIIIENSPSFAMIGILYAEKKIDIDDFDVAESLDIDGSVISHDAINFKKIDASAYVDIDWGAAVLNEPPGFTCNMKFAVGTWEEVY